MSSLILVDARVIFLNRKDDVISAVIATAGCIHTHPLPALVGLQVVDQTGQPL